MAALSFDTHSYVKKLVEAGLTERQAEAQVQALVAVVNENLATKQDIESIRLEIREVEARLRREIKELETRLRTEIELIRRAIKELELRLTIRLGLMLAAAVAVIAALVKLV